MKERRQCKGKVVLRPVMANPVGMDYRSRIEAKCNKKPLKGKDKCARCAGVER